MPTGRSPSSCSNFSGMEKMFPVEKRTQIPSKSFSVVWRVILQCSKYFMGQIANIHGFWGNSAVGQSDGSFCIASTTSIHGRPRWIERRGICINNKGCLASLRRSELWGWYGALPFSRVINTWTPYAHTCVPQHFLHINVNVNLHIYQLCREWGNPGWYVYIHTCTSCIKKVCKKEQKH